MYVQWTVIRPVEPAGETERHILQVTQPEGIMQVEWKLPRESVRHFVQVAQQLECKRL